MSDAQRALGRLFPAETGPGKVLRAGKEAARAFRTELRPPAPAPEPEDRGPGLTDYAEWRAQQPPFEALPAGQATTFLVIVETTGSGDDEEQARVLATEESIRAQVALQPRTLVLPTGTPMREVLPDASEDFVLFLTAGSVLDPHALEQVAKEHRVDPVRRVIGFDSDRLTADGARVSPLFRPVWSPETMLGANYLGRAFAIRIADARSVPGLTLDDHGVWRLLLRSDLSDESVGRVPHVLLSVPDAPDAPATDADAQMVARALRDRGEEATAEVAEGIVRVRFQPEEWPTVSIVVPTRHGRANLERLLPSLAATDYPAFDVTVVDNGGETEENEAWYAALDPGIPVRHVWWHEEPFNYSRVNTVTARGTSGAVLVFLNDDTEVVDAGWLRELVGMLHRDGVGTVGFQHRTGDGVVQHGGVMIGPGGFAANLFAGMHPDDDSLIGPVRWYRDSLAVTAACVGIRRDLFEEVGGFDERFQLTGSDVVLGLDQVIRGRRNVVIPFDAVRHFESLTRGPHAPRSDSFASYWRYQPWLASGDPYVSPNVCRLVEVPRFAAADDPSPLELTMAGLGRPWKSDAQQSTISEDATALLPLATITAEEVERVVETHRTTVGRREVRTINWLLPGFDLPFFGGVNTTLRIADKLAREHGVVNRFLVNGHPANEFYESAIVAAFPGLAGSEVGNYYGTDEGLAAIPPADAAIATFWLTARDVAKTPGTPRKFYLIQDYEPSFYPASSLFAMTEQTYRLGLYGICNTRSMHDIYAGGYGGTATWFEPAVDRAVFHAEGRPEHGADDPVTIFAYARDHFRNCWEIVYAALSEIKRRYGDRVRIVAAGAKYLPPSADFIDLGLLDYRATGRLYRETDIGITLQISRHPSYLPLELMASGVAMVVPDSPWFRWLFQPGENARTTMMTYEEVVAALDELVRDADTRRRIAAAGTATIDERHSDWDAALDGIYDFLCDPEAEARPTQAPPWAAP
ncbi:glycosyltransferase [Leifsonia shinshuensis]|uniref:rhamnosyltransferase WsaF family glycosyltransferase n=1 Tax=Leifsonia shinshuensis TaxID=150026 RepID=UPI0028660D4B|nr:glycosyltransferase [Leifsonia shinshuensis]MDR6973252.1 GT2 family glycosyltransferase [Leifsonia shinshuensis]